MTSNEILADDAFGVEERKNQGQYRQKKFGSAAHASRFQITVKKLRIQCCRLLLQQQPTRYPTDNLPIQ